MDQKNQTIPTFHRRSPKYDQTQFWGRYKYMLDVIDPRTLFPKIFFGLTLNESQTILEGYDQWKQQNPHQQSHPEFDDEVLWRARKIENAQIHPDTGEKILMPFRLSGFVPFGWVTVTGMLIPRLGIFGTVFWQSLNQTHNALVNYSNRNASVPVPVTEYFKGYLGAVSSAVLLSTGLITFIQSLKMAQETKFFVRKFIPFPAVCAADIANVVVMRYSELDTGIHVKNCKGEPLGISKIAAKKALTETAMTRCVLPFPHLIFAPIIISRFEKAKWWTQKPQFRLPAQACVCMCLFGFALPLSTSLFPHEGSILASELEPEFHGMIGDDGGVISEFYYNKGL
eukprot:TRINITY_DN11367_c0_g1_i1.p1 TRINITY_DN11367_c0_g1~~TRINITY_DN11367_c0_g1_i1.p1  ORF type:complete len:351 (-),score=39.16 TRINITY_DN11367_c0_g1_i1:72-1094(-)